MKDRILLIGGNFYPELTGIGKYNGEMMKWLAEKGYEYHVITTYPYYPQWKVQTDYWKKRTWYSTENLIETNGSKVTRCPHYVPGKPSGVKRLMSDLSIFFSTSMVLIGTLFKPRYTYIMVVSPPFMLGLLGWVYKTIRRAKFIYHIQDLQIDAARDLGMIKSKFVINTMLGIEKFILSKADVVSTISENMMAKVKAKCNKEVVFFPNWVDVEKFYPISDNHVVRLRFGFGPGDFIVLYSGAIGEKQGLESIISCAFNLSNQLPWVKFIICGSGPYKDQLVALANERNLTNLSFLPLQPMETFNEFLNLADVHLVLQKSNAGDLVLPSKLSTILAVGGISVVAAVHGTSLFNIIHSSDLGFTIEPENQEALDKAIQFLYHNPASGKAANARRYAESYLSINSILSNFSSCVFNFLSPVVKPFKEEDR